MRDRFLRDVYVVVAVVFVGLRLFAIQPWADSVDAYAYWTTRTGDFYSGAETGQIGAYLYSPAFAQVLAPLVWLPVAIFTALWTAINFVALWWLLGRLALPSLLFLPISFEIISGNVHILYAAAIVAGFRYPATWALMFLTKVTPGIGVLWFAVRREWRSLATALGATAALVAVSLVLDRPAWEAWARILQADVSGAGQAVFQTVGWYLPVGLVPRLILAIAIVAAAAWTNRRWLVPVAVVLALPVVWLNGLAVLAAVVPLWQDRSVRGTDAAATADHPASAPAPAP